MFSRNLLKTKTHCGLHQFKTLEITGKQMAEPMRLSNVSRDLTQKGNKEREAAERRSMAGLADFHRER